MKKCSIKPSNFNLNIQMYSFNELLNLFEITDPNNITTEQLKRAKILVLKTHPDKSRLSPEYFLFYKKAFEIIVEFYNNQQRTTKEVPKTEIKYSKEINNISTGTGNSYQTPVSYEQIEKNIGSMPPAKFQQTFNDLFEKNQMGKKIVNKNDWFSKEETTCSTESISTISAINSTFEKIKEKQQGIVLYKGVTELQSVSGTNLYDDIEDEYEDDVNGKGTYIETDPFSKLKFEDIKKVHKNETVFMVGEKDYEKVKKYDSVEQYTVARNTSDFSLKTEEENIRILKEKETEIQNKILLKQYQSKKKEMEMENKNKSILSYFLHLT